MGKISLLLVYNLRPKNLQIHLYPLLFLFLKIIRRLYLKYIKKMIYGKIGTAEQWIKVGKYALNWTRLSCKRFVSNQVRLWLFVLAYNLGNFLRRLALPRRIKHWSLRSLLTRFIKTGAKIVRHSRYVTFQMAEVSITNKIFTEILYRIDQLRYRTV